MQVLVTVFKQMTSDEKQRLTDALSVVIQEPFHLEITEDKSLLGGLTIQFGSKLLNLSLKEKLRQLRSKLTSFPLDELKGDSFPDFLKETIDSYRPDKFVFEVGRVVSVKDGVARISGMAHVKSQEMVEFEGGTKGLVLNLLRDGIDAVILGNEKQVREGNLAYQTEKIMRVPVSMNMFGRVVNALGEPVDGKGQIESLDFVKIEQPAPSLMDRASVRIPFQTGVKMVDALVPIGRGQRELIIGDRQTGKTSLIMDMILSQKRLQNLPEKERVYCVYVAIGQKNSQIARFVQTLADEGALDYTLIVNVSAAENAVLQYLAPYAGCAMAEYFRSKGMHVVIFYDDLSKHAVAYREISLLLKRFPGREAYPGDVFYIHSRLLERAAMLNDEKGGGSLTAIPVVETQENDLSAYIPTNIISMTDGQIFLDTELFKQGFRPAVDVRLSVSRVGGAAQMPAMKEIAGPLRLNLARYREVMSFSQFSAHMDEDSKQLIWRGNRLRELLKQKNKDVLDMAHQVVLLFAGVEGFLDSLELNEILSFEKFIIQRIPIEALPIMRRLMQKEQLSDEIKEKLRHFLKDVLKEFKEKTNAES